MKNEYLVTQLIKYDNHELGEKEIITLFQHLVDTGMAWQLEGHYGRMADFLLRCGNIKSREEVENKEEV